MQRTKRINPSQYLFLRSHRTTNCLNLRWSHEKVLSAFHRSTSFAGGLPLGAFRSGHERRGIIGAIIEWAEVLLECAE